MGSIRLIATAVRLNLANQMTYRVNFLVSMTMGLLFNLALPLITFLIYLNTSGFPGWSFDQILVFQGSAIMIWGLEQVFFGNVTWELNRIVREGEFDRLLTSPTGPLRYLLFTEMAVENSPEFIMGAVLMGIGLLRLAGTITLASFAGMCIFIVLGFVFLASLVVIQMALVIRFVQVRRLGELLRTGSMFGYYPGTIYPRALQALVLGALPYGLIAFFPAVAVLGRLEQVPWGAIAATLLFVVLAWALWTSSLTKYTSAGG